jgi:hypothetical protein
MDLGSGCAEQRIKDGADNLVFIQGSRTGGREGALAWVAAMRVWLPRLRAKIVGHPAVCDGLEPGRKTTGMTIRSEVPDVSHHGQEYILNDILPLLRRHVGIVTPVEY